MNKLNIRNLCISIMLLTVLVSCDQADKPTYNQAEKPTQVQAEKSTQEIKFLNGYFSVLMPTSWSIQTGLNDEADLQMGNLFKEAYFVILSENKMDFNDVTIESHSELTRSLFKGSLSNYQESVPEEVSNGSIRTIRYRLTGSIENIKVVYWHVTLETKTHFHQMLFWSLPSKFPTNEADFNSVIHSLKSIKN